MTGVEILSSAEVATGYAFNWIVCLIIGIIIAGIITALGIYFYFSGECTVGIIPSLTIVGILGGACLGSACGSFGSTPTNYITEYKVTISEEVSMTEFYEHYEVVGQEGKIFIVREK